jgi:Arc/MetJ-type ribon-helix-helix transcriptional regulator
MAVSGLAGEIAMTETEKITMNISVVDLGRIDLLVEEGFYSNRTDFLRTAIRNQLDRHAEQVQHSATRRSMAIGAVHYGAKSLARYRERGEVVEVNVVGLLHLSDDVTPELALATFKSIKVLGSFQAPDDVKSALAEAGRIA